MRQKLSRDLHLHHPRGYADAPIRIKCTPLPYTPAQYVHMVYPGQNFTRGVETGLSVEDLSFRRRINCIEFRAGIGATDQPFKAKPLFQAACRDRDIPWADDTL